METFTKTLTPG